MTIEELQSRLSDMMRYAQRQGADEADGVAVVGESCSFKAREGKLETVDWSKSMRLGLRVIVGHRQACVTANSPDTETLKLLVDRALMMARVVPEDPYCGLADPSQIARHFETPPFDETFLTLEQLRDMALETEEAALAVSGVTGSEGATASWSRDEFVLAASNGFVGGYRSSLFGLDAAVLAGTGTDRQLDGYGVNTRFFADLEPPKTIGAAAGKRAVRRLNPRKASTGKFPVVYENLISPSLLGHLIGGIIGSAVVEKTTFLHNALETALFPKTVTLIDDPFMTKGLSSHPFDGEGLPVQKRTIVEKGVLKTWLLNLRTARQMGLPPTGHGTVALGGAPGISCNNFYMEPGKESFQDFIRPLAQGFFVTDLLGHSVNGLTGDYSLGAGGFWIENGEVTYPVQGVTIAGNLKEMFRECTPASDLVFRGSVNAPTLRVDSMTVAGG